MQMTLLFAFLFLPSAIAQIVQDGGLEFPQSFSPWEEHSDYFGTIICDSSCNNQQPHSGYQYAWFGGIDEVETAYLSQVIDLPPNHEMHFWWRVVRYLVPKNPVFQIQLGEQVVQSWDL